MRIIEDLEKPVRYSNNPAIRKMAEEANVEIDKFRKCCPELAAFTTKRIQKNRCRGLEMRLNFEHNVLLYHTLQTAGLDNAETTIEFLGSDSEVLWTLAEAAKKQVGSTYKALEAVYWLYCFLNRSKLIRPAFKESLRSPAGFLATYHFRDFLQKEFTCREDVFLIGYAKEKKRQIVCLPTRVPALREHILYSFEKWPNRWDRRKYCMHIVKSAESWFEDSALGVKSWRDFNTDMLSTAKNHILAHYEGKKRQDNMKFLFYMFSLLVREHPHFPFFKDSYVFTNSIILDRRVPNHIANGYDIAIFGQNDLFRQGKGVLFILKNAKFYGASNNSTEIITYTLAGIDLPDIWDAMANYLLHHAKRSSTYIISFCRWLCKNKSLTGNPGNVITRKELQEFRIWICQKSQLAATRNTYIRQVTEFVKWVKEKGLITIEPNALKGFDGFVGDVNINPTPLSQEEIEKLREAFHALEKDSTRFRLDSMIFQIMLTCSLRIGSICSMSLSNLTFKEDGTAVLEAKMKNRGMMIVHEVLTEYTTKLIKEALELTEPIRERCPQEGIGEHVFIYENDNNASLPFACFSTTRFNLDLQVACKQAGIRQISSGAIRDTYMTFVEMYRIKASLTQVKKTVLTQHVKPSTIYHYANISLQDVLAFTENKQLGTLL